MDRFWISTWWEDSRTQLETVRFSQRGVDMTWSPAKFASREAYEVGPASGTVGSHKAFPYLQA